MPHVSFRVLRVHFEFLAVYCLLALVAVCVTPHKVLMASPSKPFSASPLAPAMNGHRRNATHALDKRLYTHIAYLCPGLKVARLAFHAALLFFFVGLLALDAASLSLPPLLITLAPPTPAPQQRYRCFGECEEFVEA